MRLILVRHGKTKMNTQGCFIGDIDPPLSEPDNNLIETCNKIKKYGPDVIITSPKQRCISTAKLIRSDFEISDNITEISFGLWEGLTREQISKLYPTDLERWDTRDIDPQTGPTGGETLQHLEKRVETYLNQLYDKYEGKTVCIVTHVYVIKSILDLAYNMKSGWNCNRLWLKNGAFTIIDWHKQGDKRLVHCVNCQ